MAFVTVFARYELKYMLTRAQKQRVLAAMAPYLRLDAYGRTTIRNIYFDTADHRLVRRSIEKPVYKEKLRIRSYSQASADSTVFVELKKKYEGVVYKRRLALCEAEAMAWVCRARPIPVQTQIAREIDYFIGFYGDLQPAVFLTYEREAYYDKGGTDLRVTFDEQILCRACDMSLCAPVYGAPLLPEDKVLMEIKCAGGLPLWLSHLLSREGLYKTSFSKYGTAYTEKLSRGLLPQNSKNNREDMNNGCDL